MGRNPKSDKPSFFKVLVDDYTTTLRLPRTFVQKYGELLPESAKLRTSSGATWVVKLDDDGCFSDGWNNFVIDLELQMLEFLVFRFDIDDSTFDVSVYGTNCSERDISIVADTDEDSDSSDHIRIIPDVKKKLRKRSCVGGKGEGAGTDTVTHPRFQVKLSKCRKYRWSLPAQFVREAGLIGKSGVMLEYPPKKRLWRAKLDQRPLPSSQHEITVGWNDFRRENGLVTDGTYSFEFDAVKNVIRVGK